MSVCEIRCICVRRLGGVKQHFYIALVLNYF